MEHYLIMEVDLICSPSGLLIFKTIRGLRAGVADAGPQNSHLGNYY